MESFLGQIGVIFCYFEASWAFLDASWEQQFFLKGVAEFANALMFVLLIMGPIPGPKVLIFVDIGGVICWSLLFLNF